MVELPLHTSLVHGWPSSVHAVPLLSQALDEPSAYEIAVPGADLNDASARSLG